MKSSSQVSESLSWDFEVSRSFRNLGQTFVFFLFFFSSSECIKLLLCMSLFLSESLPVGPDSEAWLQEQCALSQLEPCAEHCSKHVCYAHGHRPTAGQRPCLRQTCVSASVPKCSHTKKILYLFFFHCGKLACQNIVPSILCILNLCLLTSVKHHRYGELNQGLDMPDLLTPPKHGWIRAAL